jgi:predicted phosphodiesterase
MKYLVVSDTHGYHANLIKVLEKVRPITALIHLGDLQCSPDKIEELAGCSVYAVGGNCDIFNRLEKEKL